MSNDATAQDGGLRVARLAVGLSQQEVALSRARCFLGYPRVLERGRVPHSSKRGSKPHGLDRADPHEDGMYGAELDVSTVRRC